MDKLIDLLLNSFDFGFMLAVNVLTYFIIKTIDYCNGDKAVPTWIKRIIAFISGIILGLIVTFITGFNTTILYSFVLSLVSWDCLFKPIIKRFKNLDYKNDNGLKI